MKNLIWRQWFSVRSGIRLVKSDSSAPPNLPDRDRTHDNPFVQKKKQKKKNALLSDLQCTDLKKK